MIRTSARIAIACLAAPSLALAQPTPQDTQQGRQQQNPPAESHQEQQDKPPKIEGWAVHVQATDIYQYHPAFPAAFDGPNSFGRGNRTGNTVDLTLYAGVAPWTGAELWVNPEMYQGFAPSNTLGVAGYVDGDGAKVGKKKPYVRTARLFLRQTIDLGGKSENNDPDLNQLGGVHTTDRLVFTAGKFNVTDVFDTNKYAHDPRHDFINWSVIDTGSFDYAADAWGYSYGAAGEWYRGDWTFRVGAFDMSLIPNNKTLTPDLSQFQVIGEVERRWSIGERKGAVRVAGFVSRARMGLYDDAVAFGRAAGALPDTALVRRYRSRPGGYINAEQQVIDGVGVFARAGWTDGRYESYEYTDIDRTLQAGVSLEGKLWGRKDDGAGVALVANDLSSEGKRYLNAGGLGILVGDGRLLHPGTEHIMEAYYSLAVLSFAQLSLDWQLIDNPAYNRDRGPANVIGARLHLQK